MHENNYSFILPEGLIETIQSTLKENGKISYTKRNKPTKDGINLLHKYLYIPHLLLQNKIFKSDSYEKTGVAINFTLIKNILSLSSEETKAIVDYYIEVGIIELVNSYIFLSLGSKENKCRTYRFTNEWNNVKVYNYQCPTDSTFIKRLIETDYSKKPISSKSPATKANDDIVDYQLKVFNESVGLHQSVYKYFTNKYSVSVDELMDGDIKVDINDYIFYSIIRKDFKITRPDGDSRIYSPLTSIKREHRKYITLNGKQLIGLDVVGCQMLLSSIAVENYFTNTYDGVELPDDMVYYRQLAEAGMLYEKLAEAEVKTSLLTKDRTAYKQRLYKGFFFSKNSKRLNKIQQAFKSLFPSVFDTIVNIKASNEYNSWAITLQKVESVLMLDLISKQLIDKGIQFLNLHDGLYFSTIEDLKVGEEILINCFKDNGGVNVRTKIEQYDEPFEFIEEGKDKNVIWFESMANVKLVNHYFKVADTYFNVKKLTRKEDSKGSKSKKLTKKEFLKLYEEKKAVEQEIENKEVKVVSMLEYNDMIFKSKYIYNQFRKIEELGFQLDPGKIDQYNIYDFNEEWEFHFGSEYNSAIINKHTRMSASYGGYRQYPIEEFVPDIISLIKEEQLLLQSIATK
ncbi:hypothetical protein [Chitinophaga sancti]|uniref:Uncharacterized protein n=1 Tax=Chitinophaga sancti TaxID=1004 RepID=A0A1K1T315_9BACT|nr:hypothetical protein [Chitinophaga sancti]WQD61429.1 hypothetical protein U0033_26490 [Chitinophaga sancti]WQG93018.1 hypothetical protein SR876_15970 [Chitinophaga sancti]SFW90971.1 hypothetical protein SAMN05661012_06706 [Chitinophaga sancti]